MIVVTVLLVVAATLLGIGALLAVLRIVLGPSILDRMIAADVLIAILIGAMGVEMVVDEHTRTLPVMLVLAATAFLGTVAVARYVTKRGSS